MATLLFLVDMSPYYQGIGYEQGDTIHCQWNGQAISITGFYWTLSWWILSLVAPNSNKILIPACARMVGILGQIGQYVSGRAS